MAEGQVGVDQQQPQRLIRATFAIDADTWARFEAVANAQHRTRSAICRMHVEQLVVKHDELERTAAA